MSNEIEDIRRSSTLEIKHEERVLLRFYGEINGENVLEVGSAERTRRLEFVSQNGLRRLSKLIPTESQ
jgi:hypothetical protein